MKVLVIDDDTSIAQVISLCFEMRWPETTVLSAVDGKQGLALVKQENPDVVILDIGLPEMNGFEVCYRIRRFSDVPVIMLTVRDSDTDVSVGLEVGADDYVIKPFSYIQLLSRVQAVLRRSSGKPAATAEYLFSTGNLVIDFDSREVRVNDMLVGLTPIEYDLLSLLGRNVGKVMKYQTLLTRVWSEEYGFETNLLKAHIHNLRRKLGDDTQNPGMIVNERGVGYRLLADQKEALV